jgi:cytochrome c-type biogenesis protein CcmF
MFLGFTGHSWNKDTEATLTPGQTMQVDDRLSIEYVGPRMEVDTGKRMIFADVRVMEHGKFREQLSPAKFIYKKTPESPTTEVSMMHSIRDDLYLVVGQMNPETKTASLQIHVNSLVFFIWFGAMILGFGSIVCMWPELEPQESRVWRAARGTAAVGASITLGIILALLPTPAFAQTSSSHAGVVHIENSTERDIFSQLRCMCGSCARDLLSTCSCTEADEMREKIRSKIQAGQTRDQILTDYSAEFGSDALAIPPNTGAMRAIYMVPIAGITLGTVGLAYLATRWKAKKSDSGVAKHDKKKSADEKDAYDARLDEELRDLDDDG